jgi:hypothetical protein
MGFIRKRANGALAYVFMWKGKRATVESIPFEF